MHDNDEEYVEPYLVVGEPTETDKDLALIHASVGLPLISALGCACGKKDCDKVYLKIVNAEIEKSGDLVTVLVPMRRIDMVSLGKAMLDDQKRWAEGK